MKYSVVPSPSCPSVHRGRSLRCLSGFLHFVQADKVAVVVGLFLAVVPPPLTAQDGGFTVLRTGGGNALVTEAVHLPEIVQTPLISPRLELNFGFATDELFGPGQIFDSFTATLSAPRDQTSAILFVIDASGLVLVPPTPDTLALDRNTFLLSPIDFPSLTPILEHRSAFHLALPVPAEFAGQPMTLFFDLFDNQNSTPSLGWFSGVTIVSVPEPSSLGIGLLGVLLLVAWKRRDR